MDLVYNGLARQQLAMMLPVCYMGIRVRRAARQSAACSANLQYGPHNWRASQLHFAVQPCTRMPGNSWLACQCQCQGLLAACCCTLPDNGFLCLLLARAACAFDASCPGRSTISCKWSSLQANSKKKLVVSMVAADAGNHTTAFAVRSAAETS
jgi:hypothetical protein